MARRSKEELLEEFHRLYDIFDVVVDIQEEQFPEVYNRELIPYRDKVLKLVEDGTATISEVLSGVREALNDTFDLCEFGSKHLTADGRARGEYLLRRYREITGRDYFDDAGRADSVARQLLKRGKVSSDEEFRLLNLFASDTEQNVFKPAELEKVEQMMFDYEESKR